MTVILHGPNREPEYLKAVHVIVQPAFISVFLEDDSVVDKEEINFWLVDRASVEARAWRNLDTGENWTSIEICR